MTNRPIALAYCIDNLHTAEGLEKALKATDLQFDHYYCKRGGKELPLNQQLQEHDGPILLLVSDNFLRSIHCMDKALQLIQQRQDDLLPIVVDGFRRDDHGDLVPIETRFEKIGDIIPYINYWQNQYLDLRSQRKRIEEDNDYDKKAFSEHLRVLRQVSSEASEFLRVLRNMNYVTFAQLTTNHFKLLFDWLQDEEEWEIFKTKVPEVILPSSFLPVDDNEPSTDVPSDEVTDQPSEILPTQENPEKNPVKAEESINIQDIPGLDLLEESENIARIISQKMGIINDTPEETEVTEPEETIPQDQVISPTTEPYVPEDDVTPEPLQSDPPETEPANTEPALTQSEDHTIAEETIIEQQPPAPSATEIVDEGIRLVQSGQVEQGLAVLHQGVKQYPEDAKTRYSYALMLAQNTSDFSAAINQLHILLEMQPQHLDGNFLMGELSELEDYYDKARHFYLQVAEVDATYSDVYYRLGIVTLNHFPREKKQAAKYFKKAAKTNPNHIDAHYQYALLMNESLSKPHKALDYFLKVCELQEDHPFVYYDLALLYYRNGETAKARAYYIKATQINPELKTAENDRAFLPPAGQKHAKVKLTTTPTAEQPVLNNPDLASERDTIEALKENIRQLEQLIAGKAERRIAKPKAKGTVLITGSTAGIGKATAHVFAREGYRLILNGRREARLAELKAQLESQYGTEIILLPFDVAHASAVRSAIASLKGDWRSIDILINNAGKAKGLAPIHEGTYAHWEEMIDVNLKGLLYLTREVTPLMVERGAGHVINLCSTAGKEVYPKGNVYCATKHAVDALTKAMRLDLYEHNIRVSQVSPAHVEETEFAEVRFDGDKQKAKIYEDFNPLTSADVAETIFFIASRPLHVNVQDVLLMGTQQANSLFVDRSGRRFDEEE